MYRRESIFLKRADSIIFSLVYIVFKMNLDW